MIDSELVEAWQELLPPCAKVSAGPLLDDFGSADTDRTGIGRNSG